MKLDPRIKLDPRKLDPRLRKLLNWKALRWVAYPALYLGLFFIFAYWTFPYERLKQRIISGYNASQAQKDEPMRMSIGAVTWAWRFPGVVLKEIELLGPVQPEKPDERTRISVEKAYVGVSLFSALVGRTNVAFEIKGLGGELEGWFRRSEEALDLSIEFDDVDPGQLPGVVQALQLPLIGKITGTAALRLPEGKYSDAEGHIDVQVQELEVGDGETKVRGLVALPTVQIGTLNVVASVTQGRVKLETFEASGGDLDVTAEGRARLRDTLGVSLIEQASIAFKFSDKYRDKDDKTRNLLGKPGDKMGGAIDLYADVKKAKGEDGFYRWRVSGPLGKPSFRPDKGKPEEASGSPAKSTEKSVRGGRLLEHVYQASRAENR